MQEDECRQGEGSISTMFVIAMFLLLLQQLVFAFDHHALHHSLLTDKDALLAFKRIINRDPVLVMGNWEAAVPVCNFTGVTCDRLHHRVVILRLKNSELVGHISPYISNLTGLRILDLADNYFYGKIPPELSSLRHLRHLKLSGNNLDGLIPDSIALLSSLTLVTLKDNNLTGIIPPSFFSNCTSLKNIDFSHNELRGKIPMEIGNCPNLWYLNLFNNQFSGQLPLSLTNTSLANLDVECNHISGQLPSEIVGNLPFLQYLHLSYNNMTARDRNNNLDPFFTALGNCTGLEEIELAGMGLGGKLPNSVGQLSVSLTTLILPENQIFGSIPPDIAHLSNLMVLNLTDNHLNGTISEEISKLAHLDQLFLSHNSFSGNIPTSLGQFPHLGLLDLSNNKFSGEIPESLGNLVKLMFLFLNNNLLSGTIPTTLARCVDLYKLDLSFNRLTGRIPPEISGIREIRIFINFSHNHLEGPLPIELSKLESVQEIDVSSNNLIGSVFSQISDCRAATMINFSFNSLQGSLPESLGDLKNLESFDVSSNKLTGVIPISLNNSHILTFLNLSYNNFEGRIPYGGIFNSITNMSFLENKHLCGGVFGLPNCSQKRHWFHSYKFLILLSVVIFVSVFFSILCCAIGFRRIKLMISSAKTERARRQQTTPDMLHNIPRISYRELSEATGRFDDQRLIGSGSYGRVYKGVLPDGTIIAVKVLQLQSGNSTKSFIRECQVLKRIRHRNLIRIITACSLPDFKALVLPYMANGSLDGRLYPHSVTGLGSGSADLSLLQRVNICSGVAEGMAYLHHHSPVKVIHCDLKPSNVLLNDDLIALVSDFGIARLVMTVGVGNTAVDENMGNSTANMLCGSIGYIAPGTIFHFVFHLRNRTIRVSPI